VTNIKIYLLLTFVLIVLISPRGTAFAADTAEVSDGPAEKRSGERSARVTWFGHSMFLIEFESVKILFDPYSDVGYPMPLRPISCDICVLSHKHADHSNLNIVGGAPRP